MWLSFEHDNILQLFVIELAAGDHSQSDRNKRFSTCTRALVLTNIHFNFKTILNYPNISFK